MTSFKKSSKALKPKKVTKNGRTKYILKSGRYHNDNGPALIENDGKYKEWRIEGLLHNSAGPAIIEGDFEFYYLNGTELPKEIWEMRVGKVKPEFKLIVNQPIFPKPEFKIMLNKTKIPMGEFIRINGTKLEQFVDGIRHNSTGPAIIDINRLEVWIYYGKLHRNNNLPSLTKGKYKLYHHMGNLHRTDGPAYNNGNIQKYYLHGIEYKNKNLFLKALTS